LLKILVSAYACESGKGSEPGTGWNRVLQTARFSEVWVITRANNRAAVEKEVAGHPLPNTHFVYFDFPRWASFWKKGHRGIQAYYYLWQLGAYFVARKLHRQVGFDVVHHVTFCKYWVPSFLVFLPVTFLWGPVGGGESMPSSFWHSLSCRGKAYELLRDCARNLAQLDPFVRLTARRAASALATTEETRKRLCALGCSSVSILSNAALAEEEIRQLSCIPLREGNPFRVASVGSLLHLKGFDLGLSAFAKFSRQFPASEYWLIGDGPERKRLEKIAGRLEVAKRVTFWGAVPRSKVLEMLADCDVLLHPALHDSSGWASLEAMAAGRPVICLDLGGPALQVTEETGIKVPAMHPEQAVHDLAAALYELAQDPSRRASLGQAARERVAQQFGWEKQGEHLIQIYNELARNMT
jgi:glycosyltransferase involved in cell wall biosynthesis